MDCSTITYVSAVLGAALAVSELLPHVSLTQCNSIMEIVLLIFKKKNACANPIKEASDDLQQHNHELQVIIDAMKQEVVTELKKELNAMKEIRNSLDFKPSASILEQVDRL